MITGVRQPTSPVLGSRFLVLGSWFSVLGSRFSVLSSWFSVLGSWFSVLGSQFSVLGSQSSVLARNHERFAPIKNDEHRIVGRTGYHKTTLKLPVSACFTPFRFNRPS